MKKFYSLMVICLTTIFHFTLFAQNFKMSKLGQYQYTNLSTYGVLNDVWGHVDSLGNEYAIVGLEKGVSIVDVTDPQNLTQVFYSPGPTTIWRDIKTWNKHAYITNEKSGGLKIIDLSKLPGQITTGDVYYHTGSNYPFQDAHNLYIDENGVAYIFGAGFSNKGAIFLGLNNDPKNPQELGIFDSLYLHDGMVRGDTLWGAAVYQGVFLAIDVSNKSNPVVRGSQFTPDFISHNCWISDDGNYLFTTDEQSGAYIASYDVSDVLNMQNLDVIQSNPGSGVIPHNTHVIGDFLVNSYYKDGVTVIDITHPEKMVEVGSYDTEPNMQGSGFEGCWGAYPWLPSGNILATDINNGLFVLSAQYEKGAYIEGTIRTFSDSLKLPGVTIQSLSTGDTLIGGLNGFYEFAFPDSGLYRFAFSKTGYLPDTMDVFLQSGQLVVADIYMKSEIPFGLSGTVYNNQNAPVDNAQVFFESKYNNYIALTDQNGYFEVDSVYEGFYGITSGKWLYRNSCEFMSITGSDSLHFEIMPGIYDDFTLDFGWMATGNGTNGHWERERLKKDIAFHTLDYPTSDVELDCSGFGMVSGVSGNSDHDIDGGWNYIVSPGFDVSLFNRPQIDVSFWFRNDATTGMEDTLILGLISGADTVEVFWINNFNNPDQAQWIERQIEIGAFDIDPTDVRFFAKAGDFGTDDLLEVAIDYFSVHEGPVGINEVESKMNLLVYPNPTGKILHFRMPSEFQAIRFEILDLNGRILQEGIPTFDDQVIFLNEKVQGLNILRIKGAGGEQIQERFIRM